MCLLPKDPNYITTSVQVTNRTYTNNIYVVLFATDVMKLEKVRHKTFHYGNKETNKTIKVITTQSICNAVHYANKCHIKIIEVTSFVAPSK